MKRESRKVPAQRRIKRKIEYYKSWCTENLVSSNNMRDGRLRETQKYNKLRNVPVMVDHCSL